MPHQPPAGSEPDHAHAVFAAFLDRQRRGGSIDLETLCREHAELAEDLRQLDRQWQAFAPHAHRLACLGTNLAASAGPATTEPREDSRVGGPTSGLVAERLERLAARRGLASQRYEVRGEVARGGMGVVLRAWDQDLGRPVAMKVIGAAPPDSSSREVDPRVLERFLDEAQITGQLDHPGVVPVHELAVDDAGRACFTMRLVKGRTADEVFELARAEREGWSLTRALEVVLKVCDTLAYAHGKGVLHRDLKPSNVMVGRFGEVYVMDWGLAKVMGERDRRDLRIAPLDTPQRSRVRTDRSAEMDSDPDSPLMTMDGAIVGTPCYMSPEQATGKIEDVDERSDVYAVGALIYTLLTGRQPYLEPGQRASPHTVLRWVSDGPPLPVTRLAPHAPGELVAICEKAMARRSEDRYASALQLANDLRAFLAGRVVRAYRTGAWAEARAWVRRNRKLAASFVAAVLAMVVGTVVSLVHVRQARAERDRADGIAKDLSAKMHQNDELTGFKHLSRAMTAVQEGQPDWSERVEDMRRFLTQHDAPLRALRSEIQDRLDVLTKRRAAPEHGMPDSADPSRAPSNEAERVLEEALRQLLHEASSVKSFTFTQVPSGTFSLPPSDSLRTIAWYGAVVESGDVVVFGDYTISTDRVHGAWVTQNHPNVRVTWQQAREAIARADGISASDRYRQHPVDLTPQAGLVPIGMNPVTKLWEFYHVFSASNLTIPQHLTDGTIAVENGTGIIFVLLPGGRFWMGAQSTDPRGPNFDRAARSDEGPVHEVTVAPFFLARHELTKGQWKRLTAGAHSHQLGVHDGASGLITEAHPVEHVSHLECTLWLERHGLALPTEAQWEYGCRAGTTTPWWTGDQELSLQRAANCQTIVSMGGVNRPDSTEWPSAPVRVGRHEANGFGLFDVHGNVWEWCEDRYAPYGTPPGTGVMQRIRPSPDRVYRGGSFLGGSDLARSSMRNRDPDDVRSFNLGVRPARALKR